jgi:hypothetical protein
MSPARELCGTGAPPDGFPKVWARLDLALAKA